MNLLNNLQRYYPLISILQVNKILNKSIIRELKVDDYYIIENFCNSEYLTNISVKAEKALCQDESVDSIILYYLAHIEYGKHVVLSDTLIKIINENLFYCGQYRVPYLDVRQMILETNKYSSGEIVLLNVIINTCYSKPGIVGSNVDMYKLKEYNEDVSKIINQHTNVGSDGFNNEYLISQMKGGLSIDVLLGCPMGCAYCYRIDSEYSEEYIEHWHPDSRICSEVIIERLMSHPWFTPHVTPLGIHMSTTEAFLPQIWPITLEILNLLEKYKLTNRVSIITKWFLDEEQILKLEQFKYIDIDICVCYSGMPTNIEPSSSKKRLGFLKRLVDSKSPHIHAIAYYRPIIEGYNTSERIINEVVSDIKNTGVKVIVLGGLKFSKKHRNYFLSKGFPLPRGNFLPGKKVLQDKTVSKIMKAFKNVYAGEPIPYILRRSSCSRIIAHGNKYPDYNAHWYNKQKNCMLNCDHYDICSKCLPPQTEIVLDLLERINKANIKYVITNNALILFTHITMFEKTFITQNIFFPVLDLYSLQALNDEGKNELLSNYKHYIIESISLIEDEEVYLSLLKLTNIDDYSRIVDLIYKKILGQKVSLKLWFEVKWSYLLLQYKNSKTEENELKIVLNCILALIDDYVKSLAHENLSPEYVWAIDDSGRNIIHLLADKLLELNFATIIEETDDAWISYADSYFCTESYNMYSDIRKIGYVLVIKSLLSKYYINRLIYPLNIGIVIPMYNEKNTILGPTECDEGKNSIFVKYKQIEWLTSNSKIKCDFLYVDDFDPNGSGEIAMSVIKNSHELTKRVRVVSLSSIMADASENNKSENPIKRYKSDDGEWKKGGSVLWGMYELAKQNYDYVAFCDCDLLYPLEQLGLLLDLCMNNGGISVASRKLDNSFGYYNANGMDKIALKYQQSIKSVFNIEINDIQAGFKCMSSNVALKIIPQTFDRSLSFDVELLSLAQQYGYSINEVGVLTLHVYKIGKVRTARNYLKMFNNAVQIGQIHNTCDKIYDDLPIFQE